MFVAQYRGKVAALYRTIEEIYGKSVGCAVPVTERLAVVALGKILGNGGNYIFGLFHVVGKCGGLGYVKKKALRTSFFVTFCGFFV